jgi:hypothetical protein
MSGPKEVGGVFDPSMYGGGGQLSGGFFGGMPPISPMTQMASAPSGGGEPWWKRLLGGVGSFFGIGGPGGTSASSILGSPGAKIGMLGMAAKPIYDAYHDTKDEAKRHSKQAEQYTTEAVNIAKALGKQSIDSYNKGAAQVRNDSMRMAYNFYDPTNPLATNPMAGAALPDYRISADPFASFFAPAPQAEAPPSSGSGGGPAQPVKKGPWQGRDRSYGGSKARVRDDKRDRDRGEGVDTRGEAFFIDPYRGGGPIRGYQNPNKLPGMELGDREGGRR